VYAAIEGYCMGGGLDLAVVCHHRVASPQAIFAHRGAALGLMTGWGGTQRLPRLAGKARTLEMFVCAEKLHAPRALAIGLIDAIVDNPVDDCLSRCGIQRKNRVAKNREHKVPGPRLTSWSGGARMTVHGSE
jgi:enoyl-CoA hydratase/carnithine racemase